MSGPSGGISGAVYIAQMIDRPHIITFDMGGTSTDVSLIADGKVESNNCRIIDGLPIKSDAADMKTLFMAGGKAEKFPVRFGYYVGLRVIEELGGVTPLLEELGGMKQLVTELSPGQRRELKRLLQE